MPELCAIPASRAAMPAALSVAAGKMLDPEASPVKRSRCMPPFPVPGQQVSKNPCVQEVALNRDVAERLCEYLSTMDDMSQPVVRLQSPESIDRIFTDAGIGIELTGESAESGPASNEALLKAVDLTLKYSVRTGHPLFFNQLSARADPVAVAADWTVAAANTSVFTYEVAPVFTAVESALLRKVADTLGGAYAAGHDGIFVPGGSISNLYAMHLAHHRADPDLATRGASGGPRCVAFTSNQSHYSFEKAALLTGLGSANLIGVDIDERGRMIPEALERAVVDAKEKGYLPFFVGSTAGTTVIGAYDPIERIGEVCARHGMWHHVDGCWGGAALMSNTHRHLVSGAEQADSFCWNPHKMCGGGVQCSAFLTKHPGMLASVNSTKAAYLFQEDKLNAGMDLGDKTIQCGRRADAFKIWFMWKARGDAGIAGIVDQCFARASFMADFLRSQGKANGSWELVYDPSCTNVCFWYIPVHMRPFCYAQATEEQKNQLHKVAPKIKSAMQRTGDAMISYQAVNGRPNFFRMVFASAVAVRDSDIVNMLHRMAALGEQDIDIAPQKGG